MIDTGRKKRTLAVVHFAIRRIPVVAAVLLAVVTVSPIARAQDGGPLVSARKIPHLPYTITKSGTYILRSDLVFTPATGTAITIDAPNVTLDLGGRVLSSGAPNDDTNSAEGVKTGTSASFVAIRNGTIKGFKNGIFVVSGRILIERVNVWSSGVYGIVGAGTDVEIRGCHVVDTGHVTSGVAGSITGILATLTESAVIADCRVIDTKKGSGQQSIGIAASGLGGCSVLRNVIRNSASSGIGSVGLSLPASGSLAVGNHIATFTNGIDFGSQVSKYQDNLTTNCATPFAGAGNAVAVGGNN